MALTWQNVSPSNPAGILQAGNMAAANIAKGLDVVGSSMQEYAGDAKDAETGKLLLMLDNAKDRNARQDILAKFDMDYVDKDIIAEDNQRFDVVEQQKANVAFSQGIQTEEAAARKAQNEYERNMLAERAKRDILAKETTADYQATTLEHQRKQAELDHLDRIATKEQKAAAITSLDAWRDKEYKQKEEANKERREYQEYMKSVEKATLDQNKIIWDEKRELKEEGEKLAEETIPLIDGTNDITTLIDIRKTLKNKGIERNPLAPSLIKKVNTKLGTLVNISNLFPSKPGVPPVTMTIEGTTQAAKNRSHNSNLQRTIDKLSVYLPNSTPDDLKSMAETILRKSSSGYGKEMSALKVPSEELNNALAFKLKGELQEYRQSGGVLTLDELQEHRDRINLLEVNKDSATGIENSLKRLNAEYSKVFARTPLTDIISDRSLTNYMTLGDSAAPRNGVVDKRAVKKRHKSNIQNIIGLIPTIHRNKLNYEELQQKVSNSLTRQPGYAGILDAAGVDYTADIQDKTNRKNIQWAGMRELIDDDSTIGAIHKAYTWVDKNLVEGRDTELTKLTERLHKKLDKDPEFLNIDMNSITYAFVTDGRFDSGEYEKWREHTKREIDEKYKHVSVSAVNKMLDGILVKHPEIVKVKTAYDDMLAFEKLFKTQSNLNTVKNKITDINFAREWGINPVATLAAFDIKTQMTLDIIKDANVEDKADTLQDSVNFSRYVYNLLNDEYKGKLSPLEFGERAKRVMAALPPRPEQLGDEYTRERRGDYPGAGLWMYTDDQIIKAADIAIR